MRIVWLTAIVSLGKTMELNLAFLERPTVLMTTNWDLGNLEMLIMGLEPNALDLSHVRVVQLEMGKLGEALLSLSSTINTPPTYWLPMFKLSRSQYLGAGHKIHERWNRKHLEWMPKLLKVPLSPPFPLFLFCLFLLLSSHDFQETQLLTTRHLLSIWFLVLHKIFNCFQSMQW